MEEVMNIIKFRRKELGIRQEDLAQKLNVSKMTIINLEKGRNVSIEVFFKVIKELGLKINVECIA